MIDLPLRVWAPNAERLDIDLPGESARRLAMVPEEAQGWWTTPEPVGPGQDYAFIIDGSDPRPDPRSAWQPFGVHAHSRTFDTNAYPWRDTGWQGGTVLGGVMYEMHVGTFTPEGTLDAAIARLGHLVDLGVDTVQLMPVAAFPGTAGWGYDGVSLYAVQATYGGPAALQRFVDAAHEHGLAVCLDVVYNHLGPSGNYLSQFGPYFTDKHHTPWGEAVNLDDDGADEVRAFLIDNALRWFRDFHLDALRLDAVHALHDDSDYHILAELSDRVAAEASRLQRRLTLIAESDLNDPVMVSSTDTGGRGMDGQWADDVHHAMHVFFTGETHGYYAGFEDPTTLEKALTKVFVHDGTYSHFRGQDWGASVPDEMNGHRFVVFTQNHDQVGNRALGDRPSRVLSPGQLVGQAALSILSPYTPMLFQGEEWGTRTPFMFFTDHAEPELARAIAEGRTAEFAEHGWEQLYGGPVTVPDPQDRTTFEVSVLNWDEANEQIHDQILSAYRQLIALRRTEPDLASGSRQETSLRAGPNRSWARLRRGSIDVLINSETKNVSVNLGTLPNPPEVLFTWQEPTVSDHSGDCVVTVPGPGVAVLAHR